MVSLAHTCANPRTMVVMYLNTGLTVRTVKRPWWLVNLASATNRYWNIEVFHSRIVDLLAGSVRTIRPLRLLLFILDSFELL
jgi:hypothetical protein